MNLLDNLKNKKISKDFCIIGLGNFGSEVARILIEEKENVTAIDIDDEIIDGMKNEFCNCIKIDAKNIHELEDLGVNHYSFVIVAIDNIETSITICSNLKELNVRNIFAKAKNKIHQRILKSMGITQTIIPQAEIATKVAYQTMYGLNLTYFKDPVFKLFGGVIASIPIYNRDVWNQKISDIKEINLCSATFVAIRRITEEVIFPVTGKIVIKKGDQILVILKKNDVNEIKNFLMLKN